MAYPSQSGITVDYGVDYGDSNRITVGLRWDYGDSNRNSRLPSRFVLSLTPGPQLAYFFSRYPDLKIQAMAARQRAMMAAMTATLDQTGTSATPKKVQRKPLTR